MERRRDIFALVRLSRAEASRFMHGQIYIDSIEEPGERGKGRSAARAEKKEGDGEIYSERDRKYPRFLLMELHP